MIPVPAANLIMGVGAMCLIAGGFAGWTFRDWKADSDQLAAIHKAEKLRETMQDKVDAKSADLEAIRVDHVQAASNTTTQLREIYHETKVPADCAAPAAAVRLLDGAVDRANAEARGESGGALPQPAAPTAAPDRAGA